MTNKYIKVPVRYEYGEIYDTDNHCLAYVRRPLWFTKDQIKAQDEIGKFIADAINEKLKKGQKTGKEHSQYTHGATGTPLYKKWMGMKRRCLNKNDTAYSRYGGRGIKVCDKWLKFEGFAEDMGASFKTGLSLERIDNNGNYEPSNCKWIPLKEQAKNKRNVILYEYKGVKLCASDWDSRLGLKQGTVKARIKTYKWPYEKVFTVKKDKGFYKNKRGTYTVDVSKNGKRYFVGRYKTAVGAEYARKKFLERLDN